MQTIFPLSAIQRKSLTGKEKPPVPFRETGGFSAGRIAAWLALIFSTGLLFLYVTHRILFSLEGCSGTVPEAAAFRRKSG